MCLVSENLVLERDDEGRPHDGIELVLSSVRGAEHELGAAGWHRAVTLVTGSRHAVRIDHLDIRDDVFGRFARGW